MYVFIRSEPQLFTVGHYDPKGIWHPASDQDSPEKAASQVARLNGDDSAALQSIRSKLVTKRDEAKINKENRPTSFTVGVQKAFNEAIAIVNKELEG